MSTKTLEKMTKPQQRVAIAKDVLNQIHSERITAKTGCYLLELNSTTYPQPNEVCRACALGALFVSKYSLFNGDWIGTHDFFITNMLIPFFSHVQLVSINQAFEINWRSSLINDEDRMIAIMQNIVDHNGTFKINVAYEMV